jgi:hypothetical protein
MFWLLYPVLFTSTSVDESKLVVVLLLSLLLLLFRLRTLETLQLCVCECFEKRALDVCSRAF